MLSLSTPGLEIFGKWKIWFNACCYAPRKVSSRARICVRSFRKTNAADGSPIPGKRPEQMTKSPDTAPRLPCAIPLGRWPRHFKPANPPSSGNWRNTVSNWWTLNIFGRVIWTKSSHIVELKDSTIWLDFYFLHAWIPGIWSFSLLILFSGHFMS